MFKARESKFILFFLTVGLVVGLWFANDQPVLSSSWAQKFFSAQAAISVLSTLVFRIISAENRHRSSEQTRNIESLTREISDIIPRKFQESAKHFERKFQKIEHEANVRYNRQMMSQEEEHSEFWHFQQDFGREDRINICVKHGVSVNDDDFQDDYELKILGTYNSDEGTFSRNFYIVQVLAADARGEHDTVFNRDEKLACYYANSPRISRQCEYFDRSSFIFHTSGRMGVISYGTGPSANDVPVELRLVDQMAMD